MFTISEYKNEHKDALHKICRETSAFKLKNNKTEAFLYLMYNDYYIENESNYCFVAQNDSNRVVGYILCSVDFITYKKYFKKHYLPEIRILGIKFYLYALCEILVHEIFSFKYKAHIHINLSESCRRQGVGTLLMNTLKEKLISEDIHHILLSCSSSNDAAVNFYKKNGFKTILKFPGTNVMVCEF